MSTAQPFVVQSPCSDCDDSGHRCIVKRDNRIDEKETCAVSHQRRNLEPRQLVSPLRVLGRVFFGRNAPERMQPARWGGPWISAHRSWRLINCWFIFLDSSTFQEEEACRQGTRFTAFTTHRGPTLEQGPWVPGRAAGSLRPVVGAICV